MHFTLIEHGQSLTLSKKSSFKLWGLWLILLVFYWSQSAATQFSDHELLSISYNTEQVDKITLVFHFSKALNTLPTITTSISPAWVKLGFTVSHFNEKIKKTLINHAGVQHITLALITGKVEASIKLTSLLAFEIKLNDDNNELAIIFSYSSLKQRLEILSPRLAEKSAFNHGDISLDFQDIPIRKALQVIADYNRFNLITSDSVTGNITLHLEKVPWEQALAIILKVKGLDKRMQGNILMVAPAKELAAREAESLQIQQQVEDLGPLHFDYVQINYGKAIDFSALIKNKATSVLSPRGSVSYDERTNTLLIRDTAKSIAEIKHMVTVLDMPVRQVIIEARVVTVQERFNKDLGIRWGVTNTTASSTTSGLLGGDETIHTGNFPGFIDRLNVNLPVVNPAGAVAFQIARLANGAMLDLELSAMEQENKGEVIASPRITTANQKEAYIEQGIEIPYQESSLSGATATQFKKAVLSLKVTPHITPDDKIILDLVITQDTVSEVKSGFAPAIDTQRLGTQVLVSHGETIVLGGIYQQAIISSVTKIPLLGDIPYLGWLFSNTSESHQKKELLIFVTPHIVSEQD